MFLTRLGFGSKIVVTGDVTQVDLPGNSESGLRAASRILGHIDDIFFRHLTSATAVRHRLVTDTVDAYVRDEEAAALQGKRRARGRHVGNGGVRTLRNGGG